MLNLQGLGLRVELLAKMLVHASSVLKTKTMIFKCYLRSVDGWWFTRFLANLLKLLLSLFTKESVTKSCYFLTNHTLKLCRPGGPEKDDTHGINPGWNEMKRVKRKHAPKF